MTAPMGITMAEAQRRAVIAANFMRRHSVSIKSFAKDSEPQKSHRCPVRIWPHDPSSRCVRDLFHGGIHTAVDGTSRNGTVSEQLEILGLAAAKFSDDLGRIFHLTRLQLWIAGLENWITRQLRRLA